MQTKWVDYELLEVNCRSKGIIFFGATYIGVFWIKPEGEIHSQSFDRKLTPHAEKALVTFASALWKKEIKDESRRVNESNKSIDQRIEDCNHRIELLKQGIELEQQRITTYASRKH